MSNTLWGIAMLIVLIVDLVMIPGEIAEGKYTSAAFSIAGAIFSAIAMGMFFMLSMTN